MIRLLYFTDPHIRGNNPRARVDDFPATIKTKLRECWDLAKQYQCQAVICGGDLFDRPDPDYIVTGELAAVLKECPVPLYTIPGNHEVFGYNLNTVPRTALGLLARIGAVKLLSRDPVIISGQDANKMPIQIYLTGQGYHGDIDRSQADYQTGLGDLAFPAEKMPSVMPATFKPWKVHVVHSMLLERPLINEVAHTLIRDLETDADMILASHYHSGFPYQRCKNDKLCINPGALGRVRADVAELYRPVQVALLEFSADCATVDYLPISCARPGSEVLSRDYLTQQAEREGRTGRFLELLASEGESRFMETREIVDDIARRESLHPAVIQDALRRIGVAREQLGRVG